MTFDIDINSLLFIGISGHVKAVDKRTGEDVWQVSLPKTGFGLVNLLLEDGILYAGTVGLLFALDPMTGRTLWTHGLKGLGQGHIVFATVKSTANRPLMEPETVQ